MICMIKRLVYKKLKNNFGNFSQDTYQEFNNIKSEDDLISFREKALQNLIVHSYKNIPHYKNIINETGLSDGTKVDLSKFNNLPILTKEKIRNNEESLISKDYEKRKWSYNYSGGSTGEPMRVIQDYQYVKYAVASNYYYYKNILNIDEPYVKKILLWGSQRDISKENIGLKTKIINWLSKTVILNSFRMTTKDMSRYIKTINSYKPNLILAYSGSLFELCRYAKSRKIDIYSPDVIVCSAETLTNTMRDLIEEVFGKKIYDFYGSREITNLAGECKEGLMHILPSNIIEIVNNDNKPVSVGETGNIIVTNLYNYSMPFLRYQIGDMATLGPKKCKCGNPLPTLKKIGGRLFEFFVLEDGTVIAGEFFVQLIGVYCNNGLIDKFQIIQKDYRDIKVLVVSDLLDQTEINNINEKIRLLMGQNCNIEWEFVSEIPKTPSGKFLYTKSLINE